ncbi:MAG: hypothetical protein A2289_00290 [Deltaproteobacteria bacterium RIFOXYA12_FULL_58_15]|nr:MAG: hypothetical protein A2289_00290 [Deltaproteobacteria bacterium RIFOXYA12_FULL_58_15]OGR11724.1 MAG: hypothetical protein A2341_09390 [Deltaproteobacteria bacterium RIFOXYB12_FULL_58_9]
MRPLETIEAFDSFLAERGLELRAVIVGASALCLKGFITRPTRDVDILAPRLTRELRDAVKDFAVEVRRQGGTLDDDWLNDSPGSLTRDLPPGWENRLQPAFAGVAIMFETLSRLDLLRSKVFALCDRTKDLPDLLAMAPTTEELDEIQPWLEQRDGNPMWPAHVREVLADLKRRFAITQTPDQIVAEYVALRKQAKRSDHNGEQARANLEMLKPRYEAAKAELEKRRTANKVPGQER